MLFYYSYTVHNVFVYLVRSMVEQISDTDYWETKFQKQFRGCTTIQQKIKLRNKLVVLYHPDKHKGEELRYTEIFKILWSVQEKEKQDFEANDGRGNGPCDDSENENAAAPSPLRERNHRAGEPYTYTADDLESIRREDLGRDKDDLLPKQFWDEWKDPHRLYSFLEAEERQKRNDFVNIITRTPYDQEHQRNMRQYNRTQSMYISPQLPAPQTPPPRRKRRLRRLLTPSPQTSPPPPTPSPQTSSQQLPTTTHARENFICGNTKLIDVRQASFLRSDEEIQPTPSKQNQTNQTIHSFAI